MLRGASCRPAPARLQQSCPAVPRAPVRSVASLSRRPAQPVPRDRDASLAPALQPSALRYTARMQKSSISTIWPLNRCYSTAPESTPGSASPKHRGRSAWGLLLALIVGALFVLYLWRESRRLRKATTGRAKAKPNIGGSWTLVDQNGVPRTEHDFAGKFQLIYFGFTYCPSVCPKELTKMADVVRILGTKGYSDSLVPVFVSVDPQRDNVGQIREYIREYHPSMVGLVGTPEQLRRMERSFKVYAASAKESENDTDYLVDHSVYTYLVGPANQFVDYYSSTLEPDAIAAKVISEIKAAQPKGPITKAAHQAWASFNDWLDG